MPRSSLRKTMFKVVCCMNIQNDISEAPSFLTRFRTAPTFDNEPINPSKSTLNNKEEVCQNKNIIFIKPGPVHEWHESEEEDVGLVMDKKYVKLNNDDSINESVTKRTKELFPDTSESDLNRESTLNENAITRNTHTSTVSDFYNTARLSRQRQISRKNKVLDWISTCLWKCSPGCQQITS